MASGLDLQEEMAEDRGGSINLRETEMKEAWDSPSASFSPTNSARKRTGLMSRLWNGIFRQADDFEKKLKMISMEEAAALDRLKNRSISWRRMKHNLIIFSVVLEAIAVGYAIMTTRTLDMDWKIRASRVLPMFLLLALSATAYSTLIGFKKMCDRKDQNNLERLRDERQAKIDELKERTNYYTTQQLIQRYDSDPAAKAAAATVLASKLGADSGLTFNFGDESKDKDKISTPKGQGSEPAQPGGLRNRKQFTRSNSTGSTPLLKQDEQRPPAAGTEGPHLSEHDNRVVDHYNTPQGSPSYDAGWLARFAALLVGEDPTQSFALICGSCHMHNGLARPEDFPYITYYCPHCRALNRGKQSDELASDTTSHNLSGTSNPDTIISSSGGVTGDVANIASAPITDSRLTGDGSLKPGPETEPKGDTGSHLKDGQEIELTGDGPLEAGSEIEPTGDRLVKDGPEIEPAGDSDMPLEAGSEIEPVGDSHIKDGSEVAEKVSADDSQ